MAARKVNISAVTGRFVKLATVKRHPGKTVQVTVKKGKRSK